MIFNSLDARKRAVFAINVLNKMDILLGALNTHRVCTSVPASYQLREKLDLPALPLEQPRNRLLDPRRSLVYRTIALSSFSLPSLTRNLHLQKHYKSIISCSQKLDVIYKIFQKITQLFSSRTYS